MRTSIRFAFAAIPAVLLLSASAAAEIRTFVIANNANGYGVDRCLAEGARCGTVVATAYCQSQSFSQARSFRKVEREEITGAVPATSACHGANCSPEFVAIECAR